MIAFDDARDTILRLSMPLGVERRVLSDLLGRVLSAPVTSHIDLPRFDNSGVDGYGVRAGDTILGMPLRVASGVAAGDDPAESGIGPGEAVRVFTGAAIPEGVDAVVMQEDVFRQGDQIRLASPAEVGQHIRRRASEVILNSLDARRRRYQLCRRLIHWHQGSGATNRGL